MAQTYVAYLRVSTNRQGQSGLGLEAQRESVRRYVEQNGGTLLEEFVEIESGKVRDRPILVKSISRCRATKSILVIAKLDRLARSVAFISSLMEAGTEFVAVDMPFANTLMLHLMAAFAEHERKEIGARTRAALAAAKARGVNLGKHGNVLAQRHRADALSFAETLREPIQRICEGRRLTVRQVADELNELGLRTRCGAPWGPSTAQRLLARLAAPAS
jgi:DNA invertase Pin-like site-specific DNA recombinase